MLTLTLTQHAESKPDYYSIEVTLEGNCDRLTTNAHLKFKVNPKDQKKIRWYLEDFLEYPQDPAPIIAANIEQRMTEIGVELFEKVFHANDDTRQVWEKVRHHINDTRVEIITGMSDATAIPWELIRDPQSNMPLALSASAFVRTNPQGAQRSPVADTPLPGLEEEWSFVIGYRVQLCIKALEWGEAERLQRLCLDWGLQKVSSTLDLPLEVLDSFQRGAIRSLAVSWHGLGNIQMEQDKANCVEAFKEAIGRRTTNSVLRITSYATLTVRYRTITKPSTTLK